VAGLADVGIRKLSRKKDVSLKTRAVLDMEDEEAYVVRLAVLGVGATVLLALEAAVNLFDFLYGFLVSSGSLTLSLSPP
jgi:hypothetical protein